MVRSIRLPPRLSVRRAEAIAQGGEDSLYLYEYNDRYHKTSYSPPMKIRSSKLTTCRVAPDGTIVGLEFLDQSGAAVTVEFPFDQAEAVVMTIPSLLARAVKRQTESEKARYVFDLKGWSIERAAEHACLIATFVTSHGFEVCFAIPHEACRSLGWNLQSGADRAVDVEAVEDCEKLERGRKLN